MEKEKKLAVLIDGDNVPSAQVKEMLEEIAKYGIPSIKRIYGDWTNPRLGKWKGVLLENAIVPVQQYGYTTGKNATDSAMIIDAMDILYSQRVDGFCIVSSDSDFTRLAIRLREAGMNVIGMGGCDSVIFVDATIHLGNPYIEQQIENLNAVPGIIGQYQWLDCDNSMAAIVGETDDVYAPTQDGSFAVVVDLDGCIDTSSCFTFIIDDSGIEEHILPSYVHPNPFSSSIEVNTKFYGSKYIVIYDQLGAVIYNTLMLEESFSLPTADYASGVYTIVIRTDQNLEIFKLLKL